MPACLPAGSDGEDAVFAYLSHLDYVAGLGTTDDVTSVYNCTMKIFKLQNFGFSVALHLQIFEEAMFAFNLQLRRKGEDFRFCSKTNTHGERFGYRDVFY
jgi:hypothetical protein